MEATQDMNNWVEIYSKTIEEKDRKYLFIPKLYEATFDPVKYAKAIRIENKGIHE